jgi:glycerol-3-phosphate acyltransferase PlsY
LLTRAVGLEDIRQIGSGNIGATNVLRTGHKMLAAATLGLDIAKGAAAVLLATLYAPEATLWAGGGAVIGHLHPLWLRFKGGKGVATYLGVAFGLSLPLGLAAGGSWLVTAMLFRLSSLAGLVMIAATPVIAWFIDLRPAAALMLALSLLVGWRHRENIGRLVKGAEPRIGQSNK